MKLLFLIAFAPTAGAPPPKLMFERSSLMFFPSRALVRRLAQIGSRLAPAALVITRIFSDWELMIRYSRCELRSWVIYGDIYAIISEDEGCICCSASGRGLDK
jgi:hypothetical protein